MHTLRGLICLFCTQAYTPRSTINGSNARPLTGTVPPPLNTVTGVVLLRRIFYQQFIEENRDEITALQVLYQRPYRQRLRYADIRALADAMQTPLRSWTTERLWQAYQRLDESSVRGSGQRALADIVALVRYAIGDAD